MIEELSKQATKQLYPIFAQAFCDDLLYEVAFPNASTRDAIMRQYFKIYLKAILPFSEVYQYGSDHQSMMLIYDSRRFQRLKYIGSMVWLNMELITLVPRFHSLSDIHHALRCYGMFTSAWVSDFTTKEYFHLDLLCTQHHCRKQGYAKALIEALQKKADQLHMDITLETHELENVSFYEHLGFVLVKTITHDDYKISQYCMLRRAQEVDES